MLYTGHLRIKVADEMDGLDDLIETEGALRIFNIFNYFSILAMIFITFFSGVNHNNISTWNMKNYCESERFQQTLSPVPKFWAIIILFFLAAVLVALMMIRMASKKFLKKEAIMMANFSIGILLSLDISYFLQNLIGLPIPSFYANVYLKSYYCGGNDPILTISTNKLQEIDYGSRGTLPSTIMTLAAYITTCCYLYLNYADKRRNMFSKILLAVVPAFSYLYYGFLLWINNHNHVEDIIAGIILGTIIGLLTLNEGTVVENEHFDRLQDNLKVMIVNGADSTQVRVPNSNNYSNNDDDDNQNTLLAATGSPASYEDPPPAYSSL